MEDDGILALFLANMLSRLGYAILPPVATGEKAVECAIETRPDLILMDIQLAGDMNGITAARNITEKCPVPIIFLTSFAQKSILDQARQTAPYGYLVKPVTERDLATTIETALYKFKLDQKLRESEAHFRSVADTAPVMIWISGTDALLNYVNLPWLVLTGRSLEQELGNGWTAGVHPQDFQNLMDTFLRSFNARQNFKMEYRLRVASGEYVWLLSSGVPRFTADDEFIGYIGSCVDIHALKLMEEELRGAKAELELANQKLEQAFTREQQLARTDALTDVNNLRYFYELAGHSFYIARRYHQPLSVIIFDIDGFKNINDHYGHTIGDQVLIQTTKLIGAQLRTTDVLGRIGGDEFAIIMPETNAQQGYPMAERIRALVAEQTMSTSKEPVKFTISMGIAELTLDSNIDDLEQLIQQADQALYAAKAAGRNQTSIYQGSMQAGRKAFD